MLVRLARGLYLLVVVTMIAFYAVSAANTAPPASSQAEPQDVFEWC